MTTAEQVYRAEKADDAEAAAQAILSQDGDIPEEDQAWALRVLGIEPDRRALNLVEILSGRAA